MTSGRCAALHASGVGGVIVGRALYEGKFTVGEANLAADEVRVATAD